MLPRRALLGVLPLVLETIKTFEASLFGLSKSIGFEPPLISWPFLLFVFFATYDSCIEFFRLVSH